MNRDDNALEPSIRGLLEDLSRLRAGASSVADVEERASARLAHLLGQTSPFGDAGGAIVAALCELAVDPRPERREIGQRLLFSGLAERLGDSFDPGQGLLYDELFAGVIDFCRRRPSGRPFDDLLRRFGLAGRDELTARKRRLAGQGRLTPGQLASVRRVVVLSRVTLGAEVAITSLVLQKAGRVFPRAERLLIAPAAMRVLFSEMPSFRLVELPYRRHGGLEDRLGAWVELVAALDRERAGLGRDECVVIDPDSRLTQLGLLPVVEEDVPYLFFESRAYRRPGLETLGALTAQWLEDSLGPDGGEPVYPRVELPGPDLDWAQEITARLRAGGPVRLTAVNLGVGDNPRKRIEGRFELDLVRSLLDPQGVVILDKGVGEEVGRAEAILGALRRDGERVAELASEGPAAGGVLAYQGGVGRFAALIASSDLYVGYDSAFQHITAALEVPVIDIFVDPPNDVFARRWTPHARGPLRVVRSSADGALALADVVACREELRAAGRRGGAEARAAPRVKV